MERLTKIKDKDLITIVDTMDVRALVDRLAHRGRMITIMKWLLKVNGKTHSAHAADLVIQFKLIKREFNKLINSNPIKH